MRPEWAVQGERCRTRHSEHSRSVSSMRWNHCVPRIRGCRTYGRLPVSASPGSGPRVERSAGKAGKALRRWTRHRSRTAGSGGQRLRPCGRGMSQVRPSLLRSMLAEGSTPRPHPGGRAPRQAPNGCRPRCRGGPLRIGDVRGRGCLADALGGVPCSCYLELGFAHGFSIRPCAVSMGRLCPRGHACTPGNRLARPQPHYAGGL